MLKKWQERRLCRGLFVPFLKKGAVVGDSCMLIREMLSCIVRVVELDLYLICRANIWPFVVCFRSLRVVCCALCVRHYPGKVDGLQRWPTG